MLPGDLLASAAYISAHGNALQRSLLGAILMKTPTEAAAPEETLDLWRAGRNPDGGWGARVPGPPEAAEAPGNSMYGPSAILPTVRALITAHTLGMPALLPQARQGIFWLYHQQTKAGWFGDSDVDSLNAQGEPASDQLAGVTLHTALALHIFDLWVSGVDALSSARERAYSWLCANIPNWSAQRPRTVWLVGAAALQREGRQGRRALSAMAHLSLRLSDPAVHLSVFELASLICVLAPAGWPVDESPVSCATTQLWRKRQPDGSFPATHPATPDAILDTNPVDVTLASLRALTLARQFVHS